jgi:peptidoglycan/xylan/chitin deacetylase (PgdA/CDA1 family)
MLNPQSVVHWLRHRDLTYVANRAMALVKRYGMTPSTAENRIVDGVKLLARYGCSPTFPTPGRVVDAHPAFCRAVQGMGAELAVHGYDHVDFRSLSPKAVRAQFATAVEAFQDVRLDIWGFRCPYLSYDPSLSAFLPSSVFRYSSNRAIWWDVLPPEARDAGNAIFHTLQAFYRAESADRAVVTPRFHNEVVEIPASIPDDLQLHDGLKLGADGLAAAWTEILRQTYRRGELFALLFHPESFSQCNAAFEAILGAALNLRPQVWIAQLREVGEWWHEKSCFTVAAEKAAGGYYLDLRCSARATALVRGSVPPNSQPWYAPYKCLEDREIFIPGDSKPFIGVEGNAPAGTVAFLRDQGYLVDSSPTSHNCSLYLTAQQLRAFSDERGLIDFIEADPSPLVRYWRWPSKARSALCVTGDLDALSLVDYLRRLVPSIRRVH